MCATFEQFQYWYFVFFFLSLKASTAGSIRLLSLSSSSSTQFHSAALFVFSCQLVNLWCKRFLFIYYFFLYILRCAFFVIAALGDVEWTGRKLRNKTNEWMYVSRIKRMSERTSKSVCSSNKSIGKHIGLVACIYFAHAKLMVKTIWFGMFLFNVSEPRCYTKKKYIYMEWEISRWLRTLTCFFRCRVCTLHEGWLALAVAATASSNFYLPRKTFLFFVY